MTLHNKQVFFFGDSLTDVDVIFDALVGVLSAQFLPGILAAFGPNPTPEQIALAQQQAALLAQPLAQAQVQALGFGPENAVTNEFTHATYFADQTDANVVNFANAGGRAIGTQEPFGAGTGYDSNLGAQLDRFVTSAAGGVDPDSQAIVFVGLNDFRDIVLSTIEDPDASIFDVIAAGQLAVSSLLTALEGAARALDEVGVGTVSFGLLPAATFFPVAEELDALSAGLSDLLLATYNGLLTQTAQDLQSDGIDVQIIDYAAVSNAIAEDPSGFGIVADAADLLIDGSPFDTDQVAFWDPIHPAEAVHQAWGAYAAFVMEGGSTAALSDLGTLNIQGGGDNLVFANGGNDTVLALNGDDIVFGGTGSDQVSGGRGDDIVSGGAGDDVVRGQAGDDILAGGLGDDTVVGGWGDDVMMDGLGNDVVRGGVGDDIFIFVENGLEGGSTPSQDKFIGGTGTDMLYLVLDGATFDAFQTDGASSVLADLGIKAKSIESVVAIDGRNQVETVLGDQSWFQDADFWGLVPAPTDSLLV